MRYEKALGPAAVCTLLLAVFIGAATTPRPGPPVSSGDLTRVQVTHAHTGRVVNMTEPQEVWSIGQWIDRTLKNPRSRFDLRRMPPTPNELVVEFESGERRTFHVNGGPLPPDDAAPGETGDETTQDRRRTRKPRPYADVVVLEYEGRLYLSDQLHSSFGLDPPTAQPEPEPELEPEPVIESPDPDDLEDVEDDDD